MKVKVCKVLTANDPLRRADLGAVRLLHQPSDPFVDPGIIFKTLQKRIRERVDRHINAERRANSPFTARIQFDWFALDYNGPRPANIIQ